MTRIPLYKKNMLAMQDWNTSLFIVLQNKSPKYMYSYIQGSHHLYTIYPAAWVPSFIIRISISDVWHIFDAGSELSFAVVFLLILKFSQFFLLYGSSHSWHSDALNKSPLEDDVVSSWVACSYKPSSMSTSLLMILLLFHFGAVWVVVCGWSLKFCFLYCIYDIVMLFCYQSLIKSYPIFALRIAICDDCKLWIWM